MHRLIAPRDQKHQSNFVEFRSLKIVYRRYAGLFFCVCVDANDNELAYLEAIHFFVEVLDSFFGNVCELDLVFNFYKVGLVATFILGEVEKREHEGRIGRGEQRIANELGINRCMQFWTRCSWQARLRRRANKSYSSDWSTWTSWSDAYWTMKLKRWVRDRSQSAISDSSRAGFE